MMRKDERGFAFYRVSEMDAYLDHIKDKHAAELLTMSANRELKIRIADLEKTVKAHAPWQWSVPAQEEEKP